MREKAEKESREEAFRIAAEWDKLSPEEKGKWSISEYFKFRWRQLDEER